MSSVNSKSEYEDDPPPVPPTTTHPLYTASMTEPPKGAFYPTNTNQREIKGTPATNPWEREEREKVILFYTFTTNFLNIIFKYK